jgi:hypothetical protein
MEAMVKLFTVLISDGDISHLKNLQALGKKLLNVRL